jgi:SAM-dependent methyltransferase
VRASGARQDTGSFDPIAAVFDRYAEPTGGPLDDYLLGVLPERGPRAVDLGCGSGRHASLLASRFRQVLGVDVSEPMLAIARGRRAHPNVSYQRRDLRDVRAETDGRFDLVFSAYALHHVPDLQETLRGIRALLAPRGRVVLVDVVAHRPDVPRRWFAAQAIRTVLTDLAGRRRPPGEALELFRVNVHPAWLDHVTADRFLRRDEFVERYGSVFPGARFHDLYRTRALCWDAPPA